MPLWRVLTSVIGPSSALGRFGLRLWILSYGRQTISPATAKLSSPNSDSESLSASRWTELGSNPVFSIKDCVVLLIYVLKPYPTSLIGKLRSPLHYVIINLYIHEASLWRNQGMGSRLDSSNPDTLGERLTLKSELKILKVSSICFSWHNKTERIIMSTTSVIIS